MRKLSDDRKNIRLCEEVQGGKHSNDPSESKAAD
jgi:hypothetical protein